MKLAIEHYEKFLGFWKDADPGLHEADDTREGGWLEDPLNKTA